jgi:hypothetical protein
MKINLYTLVDITETGERKGPNKIAVGQQTNWDTLIQVIGLRANPEPAGVEIKEESIKDLDFGTDYKGKQRYWIFKFELPDGSTTVDLLKDDFDLVPYISDLTETFANGVHAFLTKNPKKCNIFFTLDDK